MKLQLKKGTTSKMVEIFVQDSSSTTGAGLTGLVFNAAGLTAYYYLNDAASATSITLATMTLGTYSSGGLIVVNGANMPGLYSLGLPDAALTGADSVVVYLQGASSMAPVVLEIELVDYDPTNATSLGLTNLDATVSSRMATTHLSATAGVLDEVAALTGHTAQTGDNYARIGAPAGASIAADIATRMATTHLNATAGVLNEVATLTGHTAQTGDSFARIGANGAGLTVLATSAALATVDGNVDTILVDTADMQPKLGAPAADISADIAAVKVDSAAILVDTADMQPKLGSPAADVSADIAAVKVDTAAILVDTGTSGVVVAAGSKTGYALSAAGVDAILDEAYEGTTTLRQFLRLAAAALFGKLSGAATTTITIQNEADSGPRIVATVDADGNRSAVVLTKT